ncbi:MAG: hypothetical protein K5770_00015 [Lachnospiraceae bacterium]|nr:hypothetical protein [Lachnospiraceae bacterium]
MPSNNLNALMLHLMKMKQEQSAKGSIEPLHKSGSDTLPNDDKGVHLKMTESWIYIGLNDGETRKQKYETGKYLGILKNVCRNYHVAFSVDVEEGGYFHDGGEYTEETSLVLKLIDTDRDTVREIAEDLCSFFNQESVLVTENHIDGYFLNVMKP